jgi:hypothetical protein
MKTLYTVVQLRNLVKRLDMFAEAGLCQTTLGGKHEYLKDIRRQIAEAGINGGLVPFDLPKKGSV